MTKERLKELIKQGNLVWAFSWTSGEKRIVEINLQENEPEISGDLLYFWDKDWIEHRYGLESIFDTKEEAEWQLEFGNITHTERFEPPMWEDLQDALEVIDYKFAFTINGNCNYLFTVTIWENGGSIEIEKFNVYEVENLVI